MSQNYQRHQIILSENSPEFTEKGKKALGKCVLEAKGEEGKINFTVSNLKPGVICSAYIVASDSRSGRAVNIGRIIADDKGSAKIKWECSANDVDGSGLTLGDFNVAGMMILDENIISAPIIGHKDREVAWKNNLRVHSKNEKISAAEKSLKEAEQNPAVEEAPQVEPSLQEPQNTEPMEAGESSVDSLSKIISLEKAEIPPLPVTEYSESEEFFETVEEGPAEKAFKDVAKKINERLNEIDTMTLEGTYKVSSGPDNLNLADADVKLLRSIVKNCTKIRPFKENSGGTQWVRITPGELNLLPAEFRHLHKDYTVIKAYRKFSHLILGYAVKDDLACIIFGMPDIYAKAGEEGPNTSEFNEFICCDCDEVLEGKHGYWLKTLKYRVDIGFTF